MVIHLNLIYTKAGCLLHTGADAGDGQMRYWDPMLHGQTPNGSGDWSLVENMGVSGVERLQGFTWLHISVWASLAVKLVLIRIDDLPTFLAVDEISEMAEVTLGLDNFVSVTDLQLYKGQQACRHI